MIIKWKLAIVIFFLAIVKLSRTNRRIKGGNAVTHDKPYIVYLTKAEESTQEYNSWVCGGAIVSEWYIVTSAACVEDVKHLYAIAGFREYVPSNQLHPPICIKDMKKRIIFTCIPKLHEFDYTRVEKWSQVDIAVVKVETPYDFGNYMYTSVCHYPPTTISINYDPKLQATGVDAIVYGWGHSEKWRQNLLYFTNTENIFLKTELSNNNCFVQTPGDTKNYNQKILRYVPVSLHDKENCKRYFSSYPAFSELIDKYMICSMESGNMNDNGAMLRVAKPSIAGCIPTRVKMKESDLVCEEDETVSADDYRKNMLSRIMNRQLNLTRRQGICQNDHGGPLVTHSGGKEVLIGVASVFRVTSESTCTGPYLYTSTQCNGLFLDCIINSGNISRRYDLCDRPPREKGFDTIETHVSWLNHKDGPAENEKLNSSTCKVPQSHRHNSTTKNGEEDEMSYYDWK